MITTAVAMVLAQTSTVTLADQDLTLKLSTVGTFGTPLGIIENPFLNGDLSIKKTKDGNSKNELYRIKLSLKREQSDLISAITGALPAQKENPNLPTAAFQDKEWAYLIHSYRISPTDYKLSSIQNTQDEYLLSPQVLDPLSLAVEIAQLSLTKPQLRKEFFLMEDGPRRFSVTFKPNLNANTDNAPNDVAYKFDLKLKDPEGEYPSFFSGAIRLNTKTRKVQYITATSDTEHQPKAPEDSFGGSEAKGYSIRLDAKEPKK